MNAGVEPENGRARPMHGLRCCARAKAVSNCLKPRIFLLLFGFLLAGCSSVRPQKKGDVLFYESDGKPPLQIFGLAMAAHSLEFPKVPIGKKGTTVIRVRNLPVPILPGDACLAVAMWGLGRPSNKQPWRSAEFLVRLSDQSGRVIGKRMVKLKDWEGVSHSDHWFAPPRIYIPIVPSELEWKPPPGAKNYDLTITVVVPSRRKSDRLSIRASRSYNDAMASGPSEVPWDRPVENPSSR